MITALLGPTNTGKTHRALERMLEHPSDAIGVPLRLLAREVYDRLTTRVGESRVALITGEEKRVPAHPSYWVCTVEAMPTDLAVANGWKLGFGGGLSFAIPLAAGLSVQSGLNYVAKGTSLGTVDLTDPGGSVVGPADVFMDLGYLEIPVLARVSLPGGLLSPYLMAGPVLGVRVSQRFRITGSVSVDAGVDYFRAVDLGVSAGAGFELGRGPVRAILEGRYTRGLTPAAEDIYSSDARNGDIFVSLGVALHR